jgi:cytochrome c peroxidase
MGGPVLRISANLGALTSTLLILVACNGDLPTDATGKAPGAPATAISPTLAMAVRQLATSKGFSSLSSPAPVRPNLVRLGRMLAFDKILSGNRDISCMTCHLPGLGTGDARSLSIGQGATGLGQDRVHPQGAFIPRNAPSLFNLHALTSLFWDGRVSTDASGFHTPAGAQLTSQMTSVFEFGPVSALPLFPVLSREEMRAFNGNELAAIADNQRPAIWQALMARLGSIAEYRTLFEEAYPGTPFANMTFAHASNAIAGFMLSELTFNQTPWDEFLRGADKAMTDAQLQGAQTFLSIRCSLCHTGAAFTDNQFHNVAVAQIGPGQGDGTSGNDDFGRARVTGLSTDQYRFRTTPLRNASFTGPYGHDGAILGLREFIEHYSESHLKLMNFNPATLESLLRNTLVANATEILLTRDEILNGVVLPPEIVDQLMSFMSALDDPKAKNLAQRITPPVVPSGLPVDAVTKK